MFNVLKYDLACKGIPEEFFNSFTPEETAEYILNNKNKFENTPISMKQALIIISFTPSHLAEDLVKVLAPGIVKDLNGEMGCTEKKCPA